MIWVFLRFLLLGFDGLFLLCTYLFQMPLKALIWLVTWDFRIFCILCYCIVYNLPFLSSENGCIEVFWTWCVAFGCVLTVYWQFHTVVQQLFWGKSSNLVVYHYHNSWISLWLPICFEYLSLAAPWQSLPMDQSPWLILDTVQCSRILDVLKNVSPSFSAVGFLDMICSNWYGGSWALLDYKTVIWYYICSLYEKTGQDIL